MFHVPRAKMNHTRGGEEASCKIAKLSPRGARTRDRAHLIKILALILYVQMILAGGTFSQFLYVLWKIRAPYLI